MNSFLLPCRGNIDEVLIKKLIETRLTIDLLTTGKSQGTADGQLYLRCRCLFALLLLPLSLCKSEGERFIDTGMDNVPLRGLTSTTVDEVV